MQIVYQKVSNKGAHGDGFMRINFFIIMIIFILFFFFFNWFYVNKQGFELFSFLLCQRASKAFVMDTEEF